MKSKGRKSLRDRGGVRKWVRDRERGRKRHSVKVHVWERERDEMIENDVDKVAGRERERGYKCIFSSRRTSQGF